MLKTYPVHERDVEQLCLNLGETPFEHGGRRVRPIPPIVSELFEVDDSVPSGLVWKVTPVNKRRLAGDMAGTPMLGTKNKFLVSVRGHGLYYTHRIAYFLKHHENPGSMIVRHLPEGELVLGWQSDNGRDVRGSRKKPNEGYTTRVMYSYQGQKYNLKRFCEAHGLNYASVYQKLNRTKATPKEVFESYGLIGVDCEVRPL